MFYKYGFHLSSLCHTAMAFTRLNIIQFELGVVVGGNISRLFSFPNFKTTYMDNGDILFKLRKDGGYVSTNLQAPEKPVAVLNGQSISGG